MVEPEGASRFFCAEAAASSSSVPKYNGERRFHTAASTTSSEAPTQASQSWSATPIVGFENQQNQHQHDQRAVQRVPLPRNSLVVLVTEFSTPYYLTVPKRWTPTPACFVLDSRPSSTRSLLFAEHEHYVSCPRFQQMRRQSRSAGEERQQHARGGGIARLEHIVSCA